MASYFDTEVDLRSVSSSNTAERSESNHLPGGTTIVATNTLGGYIKCTGKELMIEDLLRQLQIWKRQGDQIILMADANEHILTGNLGAALTGSKWDLGLKEVSHRAWGAQPPNTNIRGKDPIDGVWASSTLEVVGFKILSFYSSVGDHKGWFSTFRRDPYSVNTRSEL